MNIIKKPYWFIYSKKNVYLHGWGALFAKEIKPDPDIRYKDSYNVKVFGDEITKSNVFCSCEGNGWYFDNKYIGHKEFATIDELMQELFPILLKEK